MGFVNLPSVDDILQIKDPNKRTEAIVETMGRLMKDLGEINGYLGNSNIRAKSIKAEKMDVDQLSAIAADLGTITAGIIYGAFIATSQSSYPRVEVSTTDKLIQIMKDANHLMTIMNLTSGSQVPAVRFWDKALSKIAYFILDDTLQILATNAGINISATGGDLTLDGNNVIIKGINFNNKADKSSFTGTLYVSNTSGGPANRAISVVNGVIQ